MQRSRDWRRAQFIKRRERDYRLINSIVPPSGITCKEERLHDNYESIKKGGFRRSWVARWRDDDWVVEGHIKNRNRENIPLDKEMEAWYNE